MKGFLPSEILTYPWISANTVDPDLSMIASTSSMTSKYASLLVYLTPLRRQGIADSWPDGRVVLTLWNTHKRINKIFVLGWRDVHHWTHLLLPVTVLAMVRRMLGGLISSLRMLLSVASGKPLSSISSSSS